MLLSYNLDISENSVWKTITPSGISRKLPLYANETGYFISGANYFTEREGQKNYFLLYTASRCGLLQYKKLLKKSLIGALKILKSFNFPAFYDKIYA